MGNHHSHGLEGLSRGGSTSGTATPGGGASLSGSRKEKSLSRSASGAELTGLAAAPQNVTHLLPVDKLAKVTVKILLSLTNTCKQCTNIHKNA